MDDIFVYIVRLPDQIRETILPCADGHTIYINEILDETGRMKAYRHAIGHIKNNDWDKTDIQLIEAKAHENGG